MNHKVRKSKKIFYHLYTIHHCFQEPVEKSTLEKKRTQSKTMKHN